MRSWFRKPLHKDSTDLPLYRRRERFLGRSEQALFDCLQEVLGGGYHVFVKVKLSSLVAPQVHSGNRVHQLHWITVHRQTLDFLVCRKHDMTPRVAIRMRSNGGHTRRGLRAGDVTDSVLRDIGLPRLSISAKRHYDPEALKKRLRAAMAENHDPGTTAGGGPGNDTSS